jgi:hypothetical protein
LTGRVPQLRLPPFHKALARQGQQRQQRQQRRHRERRRVVVFVVENFNMQRHGIGEPADVPGDHRDGAELAHGAGIAQQYAVHQAPADIGQRHAPKGLPARGAERHRSFFVILALCLHHRNELAGDEGEGDENGGQHDARHREHDADVMLLPGIRRTSHARRTAE